MIIISEPYGDHSNRLFQAVHYEAYCLDRGIGFMNVTFEDMTRHYPALKSGMSSRAASQAVKLLVKSRLAVTRKDLKVKSDLDQAHTKRLTFVGGFDFRVHDLTEKYQDYFIEKYSIAKSMVENNMLTREIAKWKSAGIAVVGVHLRRGDYQRFKGGKYFYSDSVYERIMLSIEKLTSKGGGLTKFVLFSNENFSIAPGGNLDYTFSRNDWLTDHHLMSQCDYLVGPPSTFTLWASYIGKVPFHHIYDPKVAIDMSSFRCCTG